MSEANKEVIRRWVNDVFNKKAVGMVGELKISDYLDHSTYPGPPRSLEGFKQILQMLLNAFPDYQCTIAELIAEGDRVVCINNWHATHRGSFMGISPTNKAVSGTRIDMFRMVGDKMAEHWGTGDELGMMNSLGILRQPNGNGGGPGTDKWGAPPKGQPGGGGVEPPAWGGAEEGAKADPRYGTGTAEEQNRQNTAVVRRALEEVWGKGNLSIVGELYQSTYVAHSPTVGEIRGIEGIKQAIAAYRGAFPDITFTIEDLLSQGEKVVTRWTARGTQQGEFFGTPATGKRTTFTGLEIHRLTGGKIAETWGIWQPAEETGEGGVYDENKAIARRFLEEVYNQRNITAINELVANNCVDRFKQSVSMFLILTALPDFRISIEEIIGEADKVAVRSRLYGTHSSSFLGIPPSGKPITTNRIDVFRLEEGKIIESWQNWDNWNLMAQIGAYRLPG